MYTIAFGKQPINISSDLENKDFSLNDLITFFSTPIKLSNNKNNFDKRIKLNLPWWSGAHYKGSRHISLLEKRNLITLDIDYGIATTLDDIKSKLSAITYFIHSTVSYSKEDNKFKYRLVIPTTTDLNKHDYLNCVNHFINLLGSKIFDISTSTDVTRALFSPAVLKDEEYIYHYNNADIYTPELSDNPNQLNVRIKRLPSTRTDLEGYFCQVYSALDIMIEYGLKTGDYTPVGDMHSTATRWLYKHASGAAGIRFEENGELLHCDHESCPLLMNQIKLGDKQWSAYDLYVYFEHKGNIKAANDTIRHNPKIMTLFSNNFEELASFDNNAETASIFTPVTVDELERLKALQDANKLKDFVLSRTYKIISKSVEYIFPIMSSVGNYIEFARISAGKPCQAFFGDAHVLSSDGKKPISIWSIIDNIAPSYTGFKFDPYNPLKPTQLAASLKINTFTGYAAYPVEDYKNSEIINKFEHYVLHYLCSDDQDLYVWLMDWIADIFQNPAHKKGTAVYLYSHEKGLGKSTFYTVLNMLLGNLSAKIEASKLGQRFNAEISSKLLVFIDEVTYNLKKSSAILRDNVTSETNAIERKGFETTIEKNCARYLLAGNYKDAIEFDENNDERRFTVINMTNRINDNNERSTYFEDLITNCNKYKNELLTYLLTRNITSDLTNKFTTEFYKECSRVNISPIDLYIKEVLESTISELEAVFNTPYEDKLTIRKGYIYINRQAFKTYYEQLNDKTTNYIFTNMLNNSRECINNKIDVSHGPSLNIHFSGKKQRCIAIPEKLLNQDDLDDL